MTPTIALNFILKITLTSLLLFSSHFAFGQKEKLTHLEKEIKCFASNSDFEAKKCNDAIHLSQNSEENERRFTDEGLIIANSSRFVSSITADYEVIENIGECALQIGENGVSEIATVLVVRKNGEYYLGKVVNGVGKFTLQQIDDYVALATKNGNQSKVMLGKTDAGGATGYVNRAGNDHTYFKMTDSQWDEASSSVNKNMDEMWLINKAFIDKRKALNNDFFLSHDPFDPNIVFGFYEREINYLTVAVSEGGLGGAIVQINNNLWKIIF